MGVHVGIVGLPNVGKSTLFKALTKNAVDINNYPFCTIEPNVGVVEVPDERLTALAAMSQSRKVVPTVVEFVDIAGLVEGASRGEGLGNQFLANIREADAIAQVVRIFDNDNITHVHNSIDPLRDIEIVETELIFADMVTVDKTLARLHKRVRSNDKDAIAQIDVVQKIKENLDNGNLAQNVNIDYTQNSIVWIMREMNLLTMKPIIYVYNMSNIEESLDEELQKKLHVKLDIKIEEELMEMDINDAKELGLNSSLDEFIAQAFILLRLQTFLTTGEKETRAWTIKKGATAPEAGAAIHGDFKERFIRADVINWQKLVDAGSWNNARERGMVQTVGKDYVMQDGDVIEFKI